MKSICSGQFRHQITVQQPTETVTDAGGVTQTWSTYCTAFAAVEPLTGREFYDADRVGSDTSHKITMRWRSGITPKMRALFGTRVLRFESVRDIEERNRLLVITAKEIV